MKKIALALTTLLFSALTCMTILAGSWTNISPDGYDYGEPYFYIKDDGSYACNEWVQDTDGTYYWIESDSALPVSSGVSSDGYLYDSNGKYVDFTGTSKKLLNADTIPSLQKGMSYDQVVSLLGEPHHQEVVDYLDGYSINNLALWYSQDMKSLLYVGFDDDKITLVYFDFYYETP